jgi:hypothetical protein
MVREHINSFTEFLSQNKMQFFLLSLTTIITIANLYIASLLVPVQVRLTQVEAQAIQNTKVIEDRAETIRKVSVIEGQLNGIVTQLDRIESKLDQHLLQNR